MDSKRRYGSKTSSERSLGCQKPKLRNAFQCRQLDASRRHRHEHPLRHAILQAAPLDLAGKKTREPNRRRLSRIATATSQSIGVTPLAPRATASAGRRRSNAGPHTTPNRSRDAHPSAAPATTAAQHRPRQAGRKIIPAISHGRQFRNPIDHTPLMSQKLFEILIGKNHPNRFSQQFHAVPWRAMPFPTRNRPSDSHNRLSQPPISAQLLLGSRNRPPKELHVPF